MAATLVRGMVRLVCDGCGFTLLLQAPREEIPARCLRCRRPW